MKKRIIKIIATVLSIMMLVPCISMAIGVSAGYGSRFYFYDGDFCFYDQQDGTCAVVAYLGYDVNLTIPTYAQNYAGDKLLVTNIGSNAFENDSYIISVSIPLSVTLIGSQAFYGCIALESISVSRVREIEWEAFAYCTSLKKIVIPESARIVGGGAYEGAEDLEDVNIVNPLLNIADDAFVGCDELTIYGYADSTALEFAIEHDINFESLVPEIMYDDMNSNHWWYQAVNFANAYDLLTGTYENGAYNFNPTDNITRADAMRMLWSFEGKPVGYTSTFTDVPTLYEDAIGWAQAKGISSGTTATTFGSDNTVTKVQLITFLYNYAQYKEYDTDTTGYTVPSTMTDFSSVPSYARNAVKWAAKNNIITTDGEFSPNAKATRAIAATVIYMFMDNVEC